MSAQPLAGRIVSFLPSLSNFVRSGVFGGRLPQAFPELRWRVVSSNAVSWASSRGFAADAAQATSDPDDGIVLTSEAVERMRELMAEEKDPLLLRVVVEGGGCSGYQYEFRLVHEDKPGDRVFERDGVKLVVDEVSFDFLRGATVDYTSDLIRAAFHVVGNPNAESSCGCGSSFAAK